MKKALVVMAVAVLAVVFNACTPQVKTTTDYLTGAKNGWVLSAATSSPAYVMENGEIVTDLMNGGFLYDYELDDIIAFTAEGVQTVDPGKNVDPEGHGYQSVVSYLWHLDQANEDWIYMQIPFFYDDVQEYCHILNIDENQMTLNCTINDDEPTTKGTYTFNLVYVPAK